MNLEERLRDWAQDSLTRSTSLDVPVETFVPRSTRPRILATGFAAAAVLALAVGLVVVRGHDHTGHRPASLGQRAGRTLSPSPSPTVSSHTYPANLYPAIAGKVAVYVHVASTRVVANGQPITVEVVLVNDLGRSFEVTGACDGWLDVGLANRTIAFEPAYADVGCSNDTIPTGVTTLTRTVETTYYGCSQDPTAKATANFPICTGSAHDQIPPLPPGTYHLALDTSEIPHPDLREAITITLVQN